MRPSKHAVRDGNPRQMSRLSTHWFDQCSDDWWRLTSLRGLLAGVIGTVLNLIGFLLVFALLLRYGGVAPIDWSRPTDANFWGAILASVTVGVGYIGLATVQRVRLIWRTVAGRVATLVLIYGGYGILLMIVPALTFFAGFGFVTGRIIGHVSIFLLGR